MSDEDERQKRERPTTPPPPRPLAKVRVFRTDGGMLRLSATSVQPRDEIEAELARGYRLSEDASGHLCIVGATNDRSMTAEEAVSSGVLLISMLERSKACSG